jgi:hypothetical protein
VYCRLAVAIVGAWLSPSPPKPMPLRRSSLMPSSARQSPTRQRHRRASTASTTSSQDTGIHSAHTSRLLKHKNNSLTALIGTSELTRDFKVWAGGGCLAMMTKRHCGWASTQGFNCLLRRLLGDMLEA